MTNSVNSPAQQPLSVYAVKPKRTYTRGQGALAAAMLLFGYLHMRAFFFGDASLGRTAFVLLLLAVSVLYMVHERLRPNAAAITAGVLTSAKAFLDYYDEYGLGGNDGVFAFSVTHARAQQALDDRKAAK